MRFSVIFAVFFSVLSSQLFAQTKLIAHKSHSGNSATFKAALRNNDPDLAHSNFGRAPERLVRTARLDSVIFVSEGVAVMVTSYSCTRPQNNNASIWQAGRDTVYNHPLFSRQHELEAIKATLKEDYFFTNPVESVKFIGYDNKKSKATKKNKSLLLPFNLPDQKPPFYQVALTIISCFFFLGLNRLCRNQLQLFFLVTNK